MATTIIATTATAAVAAAVMVVISATVVRVGRGVIIDVITVDVVDVRRSGSRIRRVATAAALN